MQMPSAMTALAAVLLAVAVVVAAAMAGSEYNCGHPPPFFGAATTYNVMFL